MNAKEYQDARWEIIYEYGQSIASGDSVKRVDDILSQLDTLETEYVKGDPVSEGNRPLRERYEDALEAVRKQVIQIQELEAQQSLFQDVMQASKTFVERFPGGHLTEDGTLTKFLEESEEFYEAATDYSPYRNAYDAHVHRQKMTGEAFDVMVTIGGVLSFFGVSADEIEQAMRAGLDKLNSRTTEGYAWYDSIKQVAKKSKMESAS